MNWQPLEKEQLDTLIDTVAAKAMPGLFSASSSQGQKSSLSFYDGFYLYDLRNYSTLPVFTMQYLGNGKDFFYLDGSSAPIYKVNEQYNAITLDENNILDYIAFFFSYVSMLEEEAEMISDPENLPYYEYLSQNQKDVIAREKNAAQITFDEQTLHYKVFCPLYYGGSLVKAEIDVDKRGHVDVKDYKLLFGAETGSATA